MAEGDGVASSMGASIGARIGCSIGCSIACGIVLGVAGCASEPTRIVVVTDSDLVVPSELGAVRFSIDSRGIGGALDTRVVALGPGGAMLPLVLPIVHDGGPLGPLVIVAEGLRGDAPIDAPIVERSAEISFVRGRSLVLVMPLEARCQARAGGGSDDERDGACPQGHTCAAGVCAPRAIDTSTLPEWRSRDALPAPFADAGAPTPLREAGADG